MEKRENKDGRSYNRLIREKSPYLLQHAENPVDWFPWGDEAFQKARGEEKPIFLSIGYATCHWCHVMAHESFEDEEVARLLNASFVSIKVDREERPDIDQIYMSFCQALTGQGGWPLTIFMTPDREPFFAGTYFPKAGRAGMAGFTDLLNRIGALWQSDRSQILNSSREILRALGKETGKSSAGPLLGSEALEKGFEQLLSSFDGREGGFGRAPKFPIPHHLTFLLRRHRRHPRSQAAAMVAKTLESMRGGGIFDQIGFGFHRYAVDERWRVPHFEKMLYDQALLAMAYTEGFLALRKEEYGQTAREIFTYVLRDMTSKEGGFFSAEDADSEGREGRFYVWTEREVKKHLGEEGGGLFCRFFGITADGNFEEGTSIPHMPLSLPLFAAQEKKEPGELARLLRAGREKLFAIREKRVHPLKDDKILTAWNGLMIAALAKGSQALGDPAYAQSARKAADFILARMRGDQGRLRRRYRHGDIAHPGFLDDYAFFIWGLLELYETLFDVRYLEEAVHLQRIMMELFWDNENGGFYFSGNDGEALISRPKEIYDGATPSGNSVAALNLIRLGRMTGKGDFEQKAEQLLRAFSAAVIQTPSAYTQLLNGLDFIVGPGQEIVIAGDPEAGESREMVAAVHGTFLPNRVLLARPEGDAGQRLSALCPFTAAMGPVLGEPAAYFCEGFACKAPMLNASALQAALSAAAGSLGQ